MNTIVLAAMERGMTMSDIKELQLGELVDFVIDYNERQKEGQEQEKKAKATTHYRLATPEEMSSHFRG